MTRFYSSPITTIIVAAGVALAAANASAQAHDHAAHTAAPAASQDEANALAEGDIKKVDKDAGKLTVQHGPLTNLGMPGMTMAFKVQDPAMLDKVKAGDKVRLRVDYVNGTYMITRLAAAN